MTMLLVKYLLASINGILLLFLIGTVVGHIVSGNKLVSWSNAFNGLCIMWLGMRQVFWAYAIYSPANWSAVRFYVLYWLPHPIQFAMYLIVPIFYVQILSRSGRQGFGMASPRFWQRRWRCIRNTYIASVSFMVFFLIGAVVAAATFEKEEYNCVSRHWHKDDFDDSSNSDSCFHDMSTNPVRWLSACCFLFLSVVIGVYGRQIATLTPVEAKRFLIDRPRQLIVVNAILLLTFAVRAVYEIINIYGLWYLPDMPLTNSQDLGFESAFCFIAWDYVPIVLLVTTITQPTSGSFAQRTGSFIGIGGAGRGQVLSDGSVGTMPNHGMWNEIKKGEQMRLIKQQQQQQEEETHLNTNWRAQGGNNDRGNVTNTFAKPISSEYPERSGINAKVTVETASRNTMGRGSSWGGFVRSPLSPGLLHGGSRLASSYGATNSSVSGAIGSFGDQGGGLRASRTNMGGGYSFSPSSSLERVPVRGSQLDIVYSSLRALDQYPALSASDRTSMSAFNDLQHNGDESGALFAPSSSSHPLQTANTGGRDARIEKCPDFAGNPKSIAMTAAAAMPSALPQPSPPRRRSLPQHCGQGPALTRVPFGQLPPKAQMERGDNLTAAPHLDAYGGTKPQQQTQQDVYRLAPGTAPIARPVPRRANPKPLMDAPHGCDLPDNAFVSDPRANGRSWKQ